MSFGTRHTLSSATDPKRTRETAPERIMRTCEGPTHVAKNRLAMPPELPLEWPKFRELGTRRCKEAGNGPELHASGERFA